MFLVHLDIHQLTLITSLTATLAPVWKGDAHDWTDDGWDDDGWDVDGHL